MLSTLFIENTAAIVAASAATVAAVSAFFSYRLSRKIYREVKSDEAIISGPIHKVGLQVQEHDAPLVRVTLFNKSARKAFITSVKAFDEEGQVPVTWSKAISRVGSIENPTGLIGLVNSEDIYIRRNDGVEFREVNVSITHSFSSEELIIKFDPYQGWWQ